MGSESLVMAARAVVPGIGWSDDWTIRQILDLLTSEQLRQVNDLLAAWQEML